MWQVAQQMVFCPTRSGNWSFEIIKSFVMKKITHCFLITAFAVFIFFISCKKEPSCEGCNKSPIASAGPDQVITLPTDSISLDGSASNDPDGTISEWLWTRISGPASFNIVNAVTAKTVVSLLDTGVYRIELIVKDNKGLSAKDTVQVIVNDGSQPNRPPVANAGSDQTITLPTNSVTVDGRSSTDSDNNIASYWWSKISGPSLFNIVNAIAAQTQVNNLIEGVYQFELKVTDAGGFFSKDTVRINVFGQASPPIAQLCDINRPQINAQLIPFGTLSQARDGMAAVANGNKILFAGGVSSHTVGWTYSSRVDIYDLVSQTWSTAELSVARTGIAAVAAGNKIFFAGGTTGNDIAFNTVDIYDVATNTWSFSALSQEGYNIAAATVGNKVFFAGGDAGDATENVIREVIDIYNLSTNSWSTDSLSEYKEQLSAVAANNKVYFAGGGHWIGTPGFPGSFIASNKIDIYDNATNTWLTSTLIEGKMSFAAISVDDKIFWAGGVTGSNPQLSVSCAVEIRDVSSGNSSIQYLFGPAVWNLDAGHNAMLKNNTIIFCKNLGNNRDKFDIYDIQSNAWSMGVLPEPIPVIASIISVNNTIYIAGGNLSNQVWTLEF